MSKRNNLQVVKKKTSYSSLVSILVSYWVGFLPEMHRRCLTCRGWFGKWQTEGQRHALAGKWHSGRSCGDLTEASSGNLAGVEVMLKLNEGHYIVGFYRVYGHSVPSSFCLCGFINTSPTWTEFAFLCFIFSKHYKTLTFFLSQNCLFQKNPG